VHLKQADMIVLGSGTEVDHKLKYANDLSLGVKFRRELVNSPANVLTAAQQMFHIIVSILIAVILLSLSVALAEEVSKIASTYSDDLELQWIGYALFDLDFLY